MSSPYEPPVPGQPDPLRPTEYPQGSQPQGSAPQGYGQPAGYEQQGYGQPQHRNGLGVAALVLGILSIVTFFTFVGGIVLGLLAIIFGIIGRSRVKKGQATNGGQALAGIITGVLGVLAVIVFIVLLAVAFGDDFNDLNDCVSSANSQADQDACAEQFNQNVN